MVVVGKVTVWDGGLGGLTMTALKVGEPEERNGGRKTLPLFLLGSRSGKGNSSFVRINICLFETM